MLGLNYIPGCCTEIEIVIIETFRNMFTTNRKLQFEVWSLALEAVTIFEFRLE